MVLVPQTAAGGAAAPEEPPPTVAGAQPPRKKEGISYDLPPLIAGKFAAALKYLGYRFEKKVFRRPLKPNLSCHQIVGEGSSITLLYWDDAQTCAPYEPNSILSLCVRLSRDCMDEGAAAPPPVGFLTHGECPKAWVDEAEDVAALGTMKFMKEPLEPIEEWEQESFDWVIPIANRLIRGANLPRPAGTTATTGPRVLSGFGDKQFKAAQVVDSPPVNPYDGPTVFFSYAHADREKDWYKELMEYLQPLRQRYRNELWSDVQIEPGSDWAQAISGALTSAPIVVFVVSPALLASDFVSRKELAPALEGNRRILWIHGSTSPYRYSPFASIQAAHDPDKALASTEVAQRGQQLQKIFDVIAQQLERVVGARDLYRG